MKLVVSHAAPDFDTLASLALARLLHPGAIAAAQGGFTPQLEAFVNLYRDQLQLYTPDEIELSDVRELIVVDTSDPERIRPFDELLGKVPVTLYDHHPRGEGSIAAAHGLHRDVGATATLLTLLLRSRQLPLTPELATLALLGVHDDTGNLSYPSTRPEDHEAAALLLRQGASLELVGQYLHERGGEAQRRLLTQMLDQGETVTVGGRRVALSTLASEAYVPGLAPLCTQLLSLYSADAAFIIARMEDKTLLVGRSLGLVDVGRALEDAFGGGGHPGAGFARSDLPPDLARETLLSALSPHARSPLSARDLMSAPVRTIKDTASLEAAQALLVQHGHNGLPVLDEQGELVGILSRRTLDRAMRHGLQSAPVKAFMTPKVVTASPETPLHDLERLIEQHAIGRIPIVQKADPPLEAEGDAAKLEVEDGTSKLEVEEDTSKLEVEDDTPKLVGIVTRTDLLRAHHPPRPADRQADEVLSRLPSAALQALEAARAHLRQGRLYLVGGAVRDALLGVELQDLDLSVEGSSAESLASLLQRSLGGELSCHFEFGTCTLRLPNGLVLDLAATREEVYAHPGALPTVSPGTLHQDLARRDFTVNALALSLEPRHLIDPCGGLADLGAKRLRTLHPLSFIEDPTRILRGARLAGRLGFHFDEGARAQIAPALADSVLGRVSAGRLRSELELTLAESQVTPALKVLDEVGALGRMFGFRLDEVLLNALDAARRAGEVPAESYLLALLLSLTPAERERVITRFRWPRRYLEILSRLGAIRLANEVEAAQLARLGEAERRLLAASSPQLQAQLSALEQSRSEPRIRGQDVLDLGLLPGPAVGEVLAEVARARRDARATTFQEELELAERLVRLQLERQESK